MKKIESISLPPPPESQTWVTDKPQKPKKNLKLSYGEPSRNQVFIVLHTTMELHNFVITFFLTFNNEIYV